MSSEFLVFRFWHITGGLCGGELLSSGRFRRTDLGHLFCLSLWEELFFIFGTRRTFAQIVSAASGFVRTEQTDGNFIVELWLWRWVLWSFRRSVFASAAKLAATTKLTVRLFSFVFNKLKDFQKLRRVTHKIFITFTQFIVQKNKIPL